MNTYIYTYIYIYIYIHIHIYIYKYTCILLQNTTMHTNLYRSKHGCPCSQTHSTPNKHTLIRKQYMNIHVITTHTHTHIPVLTAAKLGAHGTCMAGTNVLCACACVNLHMPWRWYGVALVSRIDKIICLFYKTALKRQYSAKETYSLIDPTDRSHPIVATVHFVCSCTLVICMMRMVVNVCVCICVHVYMCALAMCTM